jgi:hypothetical protein
MAISVPVLIANNLINTTGRRNTHRTEVREILYPWHPWSGLFIHIHGVVDKGSALFRCGLSGSTSCRLLDVPVRWLALPIAYADFACLLALATLLEEADTALSEILWHNALLGKPLKLDLLLLPN